MQRMQALMKESPPIQRSDDGRPAAGARIIKKYPNRRLYDTAISSYITLEDVRTLVREGIEFRVVDARSDEEITRNILLQVISEQEERGQPILSIELLQQLIRCYGDTMQGLMTSYLESSLRLFIKQQNVFREQLELLLGPSPVSALMDIAERNFETWAGMQASFLRALAAQREEREASEREQPGATPHNDRPDSG
jgi:polyhydroxyalkanoate synthesis repressor PhaR